MSQSDETLSPAVSSTGFSVFAEAKYSLDVALSSYESSDPDDHTDDTKRFLEICFTYFPLEGQVNLSDDVCGCNDNDEIRQLADSIDIGLLRPLLSKGGKTPGITPSPLVTFQESVEDLHSRDITLATRNEQGRLRRDCLKRDGYRCTITKHWSADHKFPPGQPKGTLQAVHIIPSALGSFATDDERRRISQIWTHIFRYFPSLQSTFDMTSEAVNRADNIMMMVDTFHGEFRRFHFVLEATSTPHQYHIETFPRFSSVCELALPKDRLVSLTNHCPRVDLPGPAHLQLYAAIGNILHASGRAETIEKLIRDLGETGGSVLSQDGSTNISSLLSVSCLSLIASSSRPTDSKVKHHRARLRLPGTENEEPRVN
ncbi:hypothetical protein DTO027I6_3997 [Penicillium roqueforti]|nr:hypothetical protein CBS147355_8078 [Penicillium roqueforti]KAI2679059.1 hypothetical protein LCP963914a_7638 [Penicillium roqueforti]KAI2698805.1 hypothetical protein CBS147372_6652 [Penicillium roqueforti]KAI2716399.1 hypothetical protein CBS147318_5513 [Penicillium roqueforti]KAI2727970.1 hypothetical protein CBS147354_3079 [Penicillium roqueforti]